MNPSEAKPFSPNPAGFWRRWGGPAIGLIVLALAGALLAYLLSGTAATKREVPTAPMLMLPPPPPPPPPPPEPQPEPVEQEMVEPEEAPVEQPAEEAPTPSQDIADPVTMNSDAQAGADAFGIGAGKGGGMAGGGLGGATYGRYLGSVLQQAFARDPRTRKLAFDDVRIDLWLDPEGKPVRVELVKSSGNDAIDEAVLAMVRDLERIDQPPPRSMQFPQRISIKGRRP